MSAQTTLPNTVGSFTPEAFDAHLATQSAAPVWWLDRKRDAYARFVALPMPKRTDETWRFSNISTLTLDGFTPNRGHERERVDVPAGSGIDGVAALTFINNTLAGSTLLSPELTAKGVIVTTLASAAQNHADLLKAHFMAQPQKLGSEKFAALHAAFVGDGAFVYIPKGVEIPAPLIITHVAQGANTAVFPHTLVIAEENSKATIVDLFLSAGSNSEPGTQNSEPGSFACGANDLYAGHGAQLTYVAAQNWSRDTLSFQSNSTVVRRDARVQSLNVHLGARQARHESLSQLQAPGAFSEMLAVTVAEATQEFDQRTLQIHQAPNTKSDLLYKNTLRDKARTIFSGLIIVDPDAQKTDAYQSNRNLMLSDDAEANSLPGLEIQANDVRCTHGATSSRIDPEQEFYLQSRGIDKTAADELLTFGFFEEVLARLENEALHDTLRSLIQTKFKK
jgi:Fe-S cluster assembly protein SufD